MNIDLLAPDPFHQAWTVDEIPLLTASVSLPELPKAPLLGRIRRYYQLQRKSYLRYCQRFLLPAARAEYEAALIGSAPLPCFSASLTYCLTYQDEGLLSLYTQSREVTVSGRVHLRRWGDTWDLTSGFPLPLSAFFPPKTAYKRRLLSLAAEDLRRRPEAYWEDAPRRLRRYFNPRSYYLTPQGIAFFYPHCALAPAKAGICVFTYPMESPRVFEGA